MDQIQDAMDNLEYVDAVADGIPRPTKDWDWVSTDFLSDHICHLNPEELNLENFCRGSLGLYLFTKFAKDNGSSVLANFILALARFRMQEQRGHRGRIQVVIDDFLAKGSVGSVENCLKPVGLVREVSQRLTQSVESVSYSESGDNALHISSPALNKVVEIAQTWGSKSTPNSIKAIRPSRIFDELDVIVFKILKQRHLEDFMQSPDWFRYFQFMIMAKQQLKEEDDFVLLRVIGRGGFGLVNACKRNTTGKLYAMKQMSKKRIKLKRSVDLVKIERDVLTQLHSPFVVNLVYAFSSPTDVYLVMDLMVGGDLCYHLRRKGRFSIAEAKFYAARTIMGIAALHDLGIVHRDLKPENILMDIKGYTKLTDFGLASFLPSNGKGLTKQCGTRGYWAPEMLQTPRQEYFLEVDWFALGVCIFEFLAGDNPYFQMADEDEAGRAVDVLIRDVDPTVARMDPTGIGGKDMDAAQDLVRKLLCRNPKERLGTSAGSARSSGSRDSSTAAGGSAGGATVENFRTLPGYVDIMAHPWFEDVDWSSLSVMIPPWCPDHNEINMKDQNEIGEFKDAKESNKIRLTEEDQEVYKDWDFISHSAFQDEIVEFLQYEEIEGPIRPVAESSECCIIM